VRGISGNSSVEVYLSFAIFVVAKLDVTFVGERIGVVILDVYIFGGVENVASGDGQTGRKGGCPQKFGFKYVFHYIIPIYLKNNFILTKMKFQSVFFERKSDIYRFLWLFLRFFRLISKISIFIV
jgi:hypothetical protein